jgi:DNA-binding NarL/FixJ family response regulator
VFPPVTAGHGVFQAVAVPGHTTIRVPSTAGGDEEHSVIDDRMRGPGHGATTVWVYDERRRVRDDVAGRLVALPFVGRVEVVGDAAALQQRLATRQPDVLLVGTQRAVDTGLTVATQVIRNHPGVPVLVLGAPDDAETVRAAVAVGARGYLRWDASALEMGLGLSRVGLRADGRPPQPSPAPVPLASVGAPAPAWATPLNGAGPRAVSTTVREAPPAVTLSMREMQVLTGMSQGKSNAQIGRELYLSEDTIKTHARRLFRKLGAKDRAEAVATGFRRGMMS